MIKGPCFRTTGVDLCDGRFSGWRWWRWCTWRLWWTWRQWNRWRKIQEASGLCGGRWVWSGRIIKERAILIKGHITRNTHTTRGRIITTITLMFKTIPQKHALNWLSSQLSPLTRCKQDITSATKNSKMIIARWSTKKNFTKTFSRQCGRRLSIYEISSGRNSLTPKMRRNKWGNQKGTSSLNEMAMLALSNPILSMGARTWKLRKSTLRGQKLAKSIRYVLATRIRTKHFNRSGKLSMHHRSKILVNGTQLGAMFHKINPSISRVIINKNNIILMTTLGGKGVLPHTSEWIRSKGRAEWDVLDEYESCICFPSLHPLH